MKTRLPHMYKGNKYVNSIKFDTDFCRARKNLHKHCSHTHTFSISALYKYEYLAPFQSSIWFTLAAVKLQIFSNLFSDFFFCFSHFCNDFRVSLFGFKNVNIFFRIFWSFLWFLLFLSSELSGELAGWFLPLRTGGEYQFLFLKFKDILANGEAE